MGDSRKMKLGVIQVVTDDSWSVGQRHEHMLYLAEQCLKEGADLVFMPEAYQYLKDRRNISVKDLAIKYAMMYKRKCSQLAAKYKAYIVPWDYEVTEDGKIYNMSYILDRQGNEIGRYRKVHTTYGERLKYGLTAGDSFPVFDLDVGKIGIMICFDNYFPESAEILALKGADVILYPFAADSLKGRWEIKAKARAIDNTVYVAMSQFAKPSDKSYGGLIDPQGDVICKLEKEGSYQVVEIEPGKKVFTSNGPEQKDNKLYLLKSRRVSAYGELLKNEYEDMDYEEFITPKEYLDGLKEYKNNTR